MPHYQISMVQGKPLVRKFNRQLLVLHQEGCMYEGSRMRNRESLTNPSEDDALWIYFVDKQSVRIFRKLLPIPRTNISEIRILEDRRLGIIYLEDETLIQPIIKLLRTGRPLHELKPPL